MDLKIKGKYALVTGGSHGIGRAIALALADEGCNVAICARDKDRIENTATELKAKGVDVLGITADVMLKSDIDNVLKAIINKWGTIHILINNVGGGGRWGSEIVEETKEEVWLEVYNKNAMAAMRFTTLAIPFMRKQKWGRVVTITSIFGREGGGRPWFSMAKSAETSLMKALALKHYLSRDGITFNSVAPGAIMIPDTGWEREYKENRKEVEEFINRELPLGRFGTPEEVANVVVFICSEKAGLVNGTSIPVDGSQSRSNI
ncbi:MAG: SDR family oxidoreductase [Candidatus Omnitrophica bacterium]|nr:SDR family oxidoreductase [Candidatus Omnitrophota bacterium]